MKSSLRNMVCSLTGIAIVIAALLALMHIITAAPIAEAESQAKTQALATVLPVFADNAPADILNVAPDDESRALTVYLAKVDGSDAGMAVESYTSDGFSGEINVMVGFDADGRVTGYKVLQHAETPGLGAKADDWFRDTSGHRSIIGSDSPLAVGKDGGSIDGITAATITSRAFLDAVNRARSVYNKVNEK